MEQTLTFMTVILICYGCSLIHKLILKGFISYLYFQIISVLKLFKIFLNSADITHNSADITHYSADITHYSAVCTKAHKYSCLVRSSITAVVTISPAK